MMPIIPNTKPAHLAGFFSAIVISLFLPVALAQEPEFFGEDPTIWGEEEKIYAATKFITQLKKAPATATVITAQQIENMGARNLLDVLKHVPGIGVSIGTAYGMSNIESRGAKADFSGNILMLLDGHSLIEVYYGTAAFTYFRMPVSIIKRVEVLRSPGSALYGTGAFGAVINVITKENLGFNEAELELGLGSHHHRRSSALVNSNHGQLKLRSFIDVDRSDNGRLYVAEDATGRSGYARDEFSNASINIKLDYKDFSANVGYQRLLNGGYIGVANALNEGSTWRNIHRFADVRYEKWISEALQLNFKIYADQNLFRTNWELLPAEVNPFYVGNLAGKPHAETRIWGAEAQADYAFSDINLLTIGTAYEIRDLHEATRRANYDPRTLPYTFLGGEVDMTDWANFTTLHTQYVKAIYVQNIYKIISELSWTVGVRYDDYSNFSETYNPRTAIVWNPTEKTAIKALYGTAFRAPNFVELYITNNPVVEGNQELDPEKNETLELSFSHEFSRLFSAELNLFQTKIRDLIVQQPTGGTPFNIYVNKGGLDIEGFELELKASIDRDNYAYANYTFQDPRDKDTDDLAPGITRHKANAGINVAATHRINVNANVTAQGRRSRAVGDTREPLDKYAVVDASVLFKGYVPNTQFQLSVYNLMDKTYFDPDRLGGVPSDFPREGRSMMAEVKVDL